MRTDYRTTTTVGAFTLVAAMAISLAGCGDLLPGDTVEGSGELATEAYDFADYTEVDVSSAFDVEIERGDTYAVTVTVDDNIIDDLDVRLDGKTVRIAMKGSNSYRNVTQEAAITMPALSRLRVSGASSADLGGFASTEPLEMDLSGASSVKCRDMLADDTTFDLAGASSVTCTSTETGDLRLDLAGASEVELAGSGGSADIKAEGASSVRLGNFPVGDADVILSGASNGTVNVTGTLDVNLAGSSDLTYLGEPRLGVTNMAGDSTLERGD
jgi:hypothetical protein